MRIAIVGPESCGKSTLALALAQHYSCAYVPEVARDYFLTHLHTNYTIDDVVAIALLQKQLENQMAKQHHTLICDTSALVCRVWAEVRFGYCPIAIEQIENQSSYAHILLCTPDLPWQADPLRENPHNRKKIFDIYAQYLSSKSVPYTVVTGIGAERLHQAICTLNMIGIST